MQIFFDVRDFSKLSSACLVTLFCFNSGLAAAASPATDCRPRPNGGADICTPVFIAGATEEGLNFEDYASCEIVRTQRPYRFREIPDNGDANDPRLQDPQFMQELAWVTQQVKSSGCTCCHNTNSGFASSKWDVAVPEGKIWTDQLTVRGVGILAGRVNSQGFGVLPPAENNGFDRSQTGVPTSDIPRMKAYFEAEIKRRKISDDIFAKIPPLGVGRPGS